MNKEIGVSESIAILKRLLSSDPHYYMGWQANIAMAICDEMNNEIDVAKANDCAKRFLDNFIAYN